jgi:hypothetical protein
MPHNESRLVEQAIAGSDREASVLERLKPKMQPTPPRGELLRRLDRAAENLNPLLLIIVVGLIILNLSVFAALELSRLPRY